MRNGSTVTAALALVLCVPLAACEVSTENAALTAGSGETSAADIQAHEAQMLRDIQSRNVDAVANHYSEDATVIFPNEPPFRGRDAIAAEMRDLLKDPAFALELTNEKTDVAAQGNLAYTRGTFRVTYTDPDTNNVQTETGNYVTVFKRQPDGSWKVVEDISSPSAAPEAAASPGAASSAEPRAQGAPQQTAQNRTATRPESPAKNAIQPQPVENQHVGHEPDDR